MRSAVTSRGDCQIQKGSKKGQTHRERDGLFSTVYLYRSESVQCSRIIRLIYLTHYNEDGYVTMYVESLALQIQQDC